MDRILNALIALITPLTLAVACRENGAFSGAKLKQAFRYFTVQSNVLCSAAALLLCLFPAVRWIWVLKFVGTAAVTVTMLTVLLFLGPQYGYRALLSGPDLVMHLVTPLLALGSFCLLERRGLVFPLLLTGLLPVALYGCLYLYKVLLAPEPKRWEDFYGFNKGGRWYLSLPIMLTAALLISLALSAIQSLP